MRARKLNAAADVARMGHVKRCTLHLQHVVLVHLLVLHACTPTALCCPARQGRWQEAAHPCSQQLFLNALGSA